METSPQLSAVVPVMVAGHLAAPSSCPVVAAVKGPLKLIKKLRKQELRRFFMGWCASLHALGFSF